MTTDMNCALCLDNGSELTTVCATNLWNLSIQKDMRIPGWYMLSSVRHVEGLLALDDEEAKDLGGTLRTIAQALYEVTGSRRVYEYHMGERIRHFHVIIGSASDQFNHGNRGRELLHKVLTRDELLIQPVESEKVGNELRAVLQAMSSRTN